MESTVHAPIKTGLERKEIVFQWTIQNFEDLLLTVGHPIFQQFTFNCGNDIWKRSWGSWTFFLKMHQVDGEPWIGICYQYENNNVTEIKDISSRLNAQVMRWDNTGDPTLTVNFAYSNVTDISEHLCWEWTRFFKRSSIVGKTGILIDGNLVLQIKLQLFRPPAVSSLPGRLTVSALVMEAEKSKGIQTLAGNLKLLFDTAVYKDAIIITEDGESYNVHKAKLSCRSSVFEAIFGQNFVERQSGEVRITDVDGPTMKLMLEFIYTGTISRGHLLQPKELLDLAYAAEKYNLNLLHAYCDRALAKKASIFWDIPESQEAVLTVERLRLGKALGAIREYAKHSFQHLENKSNTKGYIPEVSTLLPELIKVKTGVEKQAYCFKWIIQNFECMLKADKPINTQKKTVQFGQVLKHPLVWTFYMGAYEEHGEKWVSLFYKLNMSDKLGSLYSRFHVQIMTGDNTVLRTMVSDVVYMNKNPNIGVGWDKFINRADIGNPATFIDGSLHLQLKVEVFRDIHIQYETQRSEEQYGRLAGEKLSADLEKLLENHDFSDITIVSKDGVECKAHKAILAGCSPDFVALFPTIQNEGTIRVDNVNGRTLKAILRYMYTGRILLKQIFFASSIVELASAAKTYGLNGLHELCDQILAQTYDMSNATQLFVYAKKLGLAKTEKIVGDYIKQHWEQMDLKSVVAIMGSVKKRQISCDTNETVKQKK